MRDVAASSEVVRIRSYVRSIIDPDGAVLLDLHAGRYYSLNSVGAFIWQNLEKGLLPAAIARTISAQFRKPAEDVQQDLNRFVLQLHQKGLVDVDQ